MSLSNAKLTSLKDKIETELAEVAAAEKETTKETKVEKKPKNK